TGPTPSADGRTRHEGGELTGERWAEGTHIVAGTIDVRRGVLEIQGCTRVLMERGARFTVSEGGSLRVVGRADCKVTFEPLDASGGPGTWGMIALYATAGSNEIRHAHFRKGGESDATIWVDTNGRLTMTDSIVEESGSRGLMVQGNAQLGEVARNTFRNNASYGVEIGADTVGRLGEGTYGPNQVEGIHVVEGRVSRDATWRALGAPYLLESGLEVTHDASTATLTIAAGASLRFNTDTRLSVAARGALRVEGSQQAPVTLGSSSPAPAPGSWQGVQIYGDSQRERTRLSWTVIEHAGTNEGAIWIGEDARVTIDHTTVRGSQGPGLYVADGGQLARFEGNTITGGRDVVMSLAPNAVGAIGNGNYTGNARDVIVVRSGRADADATWRSLGIPYVIAGLEIAADEGRSARVTVAAGATLRIEGESVPRVGARGALILDGTEQAHVTVTSASPTPINGAWGQLEVHGDSIGGATIFRWTDFRFGGSGEYGQLWLGDGARARLEHVTFANAGHGCDLWVSESATLEMDQTVAARCGQ
ncbi:MAG: hypothetical protein K8H88_09580, partial [Sandaracinaceae bacterium]|nr:hypothetical protein [Sandaracinaceae bacterium]